MKFLAFLVVVLLPSAYCSVFCYSNPVCTLGQTPAKNHRNCPPALPFYTVGSICKKVPGVPSVGVGPAIPTPPGYLVQEIPTAGSGLYWVTDGIYNTMFLVDPLGVIAVDAPPQLNVKDAIASVTAVPVTHIVYSHHHIDHIGGTLASFGPVAGITIVAHDETTARLVAAADPNRPIPTLSFSTTHTITVGSQTLELQYFGPNHARGSIFSWAPTQKVLHAIDVIFPGYVPFKGIAVAEYWRGFLDAHDQVLTYNFDLLVSGHFNRLATQQDVLTQKAFMNDIIAASTEAYSHVTFYSAYLQVGSADPAKLVLTYISALDNYCYEKVRAIWKGKLAGLDSYLLDACANLAQMIREDI